MKNFLGVFAIGSLVLSCGYSDSNSNLFDEPAKFDAPKWGEVQKVVFVGEENAEEGTLTTIHLDRGDGEFYSAHMKVDNIEAMRADEPEEPSIDEPSNDTPAQSPIADPAADDELGELIGENLSCENRMSEATEEGATRLVSIRCFSDLRAENGDLLELNFTRNESDKFAASKTVTPAELSEGQEPNSTDLATNLTLIIVTEIAPVVTPEEPVQPDEPVVPDEPVLPEIPSCPSC